MICPACGKDHIQLVPKDGRLEGYCKVRGAVRCVISTPIPEPVFIQPEVEAVFIQPEIEAEPEPLETPKRRIIRRKIDEHTSNG